MKVLMMIVVVSQVKTMAGVSWSSNDFLYNWSGNDFVLLLWDLDAGVFTVNTGLESVVLISGVVHYTAVTISIVQSIVTLNVVSMTNFLLFFDVTFKKYISIAFKN